MACEPRLKMRNALTADLPARWSFFQRQKNHLLFGLICFVLYAVKALPFSLAKFLAQVIGNLASFFDLPDSLRAFRQLGWAMPELSFVQRLCVVRRMFVHLAVLAVEVIHLDIFINGRHKVALGPANCALIDRALAKGNGVVAVAGHLGNWELFAQVIAAAGYPITSIASPLYDPRLTRLINKFRTAFGMHLLWRKDEGVFKEILKVFKDNGVLGLLIDQDTRVRGAFVPFFGRPAHTPTAAASLALKSGADIVVGRTWREKGQHRIELELLPKPQNLDQEAATLELTTRITSWLESAIREHPEQWVWLHNRWKKQPLDLEAQSRS